MVLIIVRRKWLKWTSVCWVTETLVWAINSKEIQWSGSKKLNKEDKKRWNTTGWRQFGIMNSKLNDTGSVFSMKKNI